ncbi:MAG: 2,5-diamino-6-(ribosylamino)-4(3H)-pyrimidinone 5'-phosphate reductase [archaeon]|nr:2,5-diamino-6-(ribosylamino)-4(3H)-pyrimidinone 5'-phosphate reductase [archaeon]MCP8321536.1 2,5-diamino-6-(ribosylamino)-4(3H)-pyrimidinone 5'-phosphate reductase [archaeon]
METEVSRPYVILNAAMTIDGKIATKKGDSKISSKDDLVRVHRLRASVDAIMVGINTVLIDDPSLKVKYCGGKNPIRIVVDSKARTPIRSRMISDKDAPTLIAVTKKAPINRVNRLRKAGAKVIVCGEGEEVDLAILLKTLKDMGIKKVLVEGGGNVNWSIISQGFFDELQVTIGPFIVGGRDAITLVEGDGAEKIDGSIRVKLHKVEQHGDEVVLIYKPSR